MVAFFVRVPDYAIDLYMHDKSKSDPESSLRVLKAVLPILEELSVWDNDSLYLALKDFSRDAEFKVGTVMWPIRTALSGVPTTPGGATALAEVLGKEETLRRIEAGVEKLTDALV